MPARSASILVKPVDPSSITIEARWAKASSDKHSGVTACLWSSAIVLVWNQSAQNTSKSSRSTWSCPLSSAWWAVSLVSRITLSAILRNLLARAMICHRWANTTHINNCITRSNLTRLMRLIDLCSWTLITWTHNSTWQKTSVSRSTCTTALSLHGRSTCVT